MGAGVGAGVGSHCVAMFIMRVRDHKHVCRLGACELSTTYRGIPKGDADLIHTVVQAAGFDTPFERWRCHSQLAARCAVHPLHAEASEPAPGVVEGDRSEGGAGDRGY